MFQFQLYMIAFVAILCLLYRILPCKFYEKVISVGSMFLIVVDIYLLIKFRIMQIIGISILVIVLLAVLDLFLEAKEKKDNSSLGAVFVFIPWILAAFVLNRGLSTRVYDLSGVLTFAEQYNINQELKYNGRLESTTNSDHNNVYIIAAEIGEDKDKLKKYMEKLKNKAEYSNYYIAILWYDKDGEFSHSGYSYSFLWDTMNYAEGVSRYIDNKVYYDGLEKSIEDITENIDKAISSYENPFEDNGWGEDANDPGAHWVDGYTRGDGTEVDGYWRTNPDGDPTNNFSYGR